MNRISIIDSHTGGEPTRVVVDGGPDLGGGSLAERLKVFSERFDQYRSAIVNEPRGSDVMVGALLCKPIDSSCAAGVIFFNNVGYLGMCGHGMIGLLVTLAHLGRIGAGEHRIETPVGVVTAGLNADGTVSVGNVESFRKVKDVKMMLEVDSGARGATRPTPVTGDVAWGGNWFFLVQDHGFELELANVEELIEFTWRIRQAINAQGFPEIDHVELIGPSRDPTAHSRNFVLCPGKAYDRSPCGTGTSAKLACLAADGKLAEGEEHVVESIVGSRFTGRFRWVDRDRGLIAPTISGSAHITAEASLMLNEQDPYCWGIGRDQPGPIESGKPQINTDVRR
jgi:4-hydroxyproline epimerase